MSEEQEHAHAPRMREHPKPSFKRAQSLNEAIRQELWYLDTVMASPFRIARRSLESSRGGWAQGADEAVWALEGMARLPLKILQSAFGEAEAPRAEASQNPSEQGSDHSEESKEDTHESHRHEGQGRSFGQTQEPSGSRSHR